MEAHTTILRNNHPLERRPVSNFMIIYSFSFSFFFRTNPIVHTPANIGHPGWLDQRETVFVE